MNTIARGELNRKSWCGFVILACPSLGANLSCETKSISRKLAKKDEHIARLSLVGYLKLVNAQNPSARVSGQREICTALELTVKIINTAVIGVLDVVQDNFDLLLSL
jgi:hypothetical protein